LEEALRLALKNFPHLALLPKRFEPLKNKRKKKDKKKNINEDVNYNFNLSFNTNINIMLSHWNIFPSNMYG